MLGFMVSYFKNYFVKTCLLLMFLSLGDPFFLISMMGLFLGFFSFIELNGKLASALKVLLAVESVLILMALKG